MRESLRLTVRRMSWLALVGFLLNGNWEWLQTPFYRNDDASLNQVVWFRLHCTLGDVIILMGCALGVTAVRRSTSWLAKPELSEIALLTALGVGYTAFSELVNLGRGAWAYSELMPLLPGTSIGVVPLLQWLVLPALALWLASRLFRRPSNA